MTPEEIEQVIDNHWSYVEAVLATHDEDREVIDIVGFHYRSAFRHGWKHAKEDV